MIITGGAQDLPPHVPMWKAIKYYEELMEVSGILERGKVTEGLEHRPYSSLEEAAADNERIDQIRDDIGITSYQTLWRLVQQADPELQKSTVRMVGQREPDQAQHAAQQLCGRVPQDFSYVKDDPVLQHHPLMERFVHPVFQFVYTMAQLLKNVFLDAAKIEPQKWAKQRTGIFKKGVMHPLAPTNPLLKLSV